MMQMASLQSNERTFATRLPILLLIGLAVAAAGVWLKSVVGERTWFVQRLEAAGWDYRQQGAHPLTLPPAERNQLLNDLRSRDGSARLAAATELARWRDPSDVPALIGAMSDEETTRRTCVIAQSLGKLGSAKAVPALLGALQHPDNLDLRVCSAEALAEIGDARAVPVLLERAKSSSLRRDDVVAAIIALGDLGAPTTAGGLREIAKTNPDPVLRQLTSVALRKIDLLQSPDPVGELLRVLGTGTDGISDEWIVGRLAQRWEARVAQPLNDYVVQSLGPSKAAIDAAALLLCHDALSADSVGTLAARENRYGRWLAAYADAQVPKVWPAR